PVALFPDGGSYLFRQFDAAANTTLVVAVNALDGCRESIAIGRTPSIPAAPFSPSGKYLRYAVLNQDPNDLCWKGYASADDWIMSSLLNLTAQFTFRREGSQLVVPGTAEDRHFASATL